MNKIQGLGFGFAVVFLLSFVALQGSAQSDTRPLVEVEVSGVKYSAPLYEDVEFTEERRKFDRENVSELFGYFRKMVDLMMKKSSHLRVGKAALNVTPTAYKAAKALKKLQKTDKSPPMADGYCSKMGDSMLAIIASKSQEKIEDDDARRRIDGLLNAIEQMAAKSKVGMYLDWSKLTVNGQPLIDFYAPAIRWFKDAGYGAEMKIFEGLAHIVKRFSSPTEAA